MRMTFVLNNTRRHMQIRVTRYLVNNSQELSVILQALLGIN